MLEPFLIILQIMLSVILILIILTYRSDNEGFSSFLDTSNFTYVSERNFQIFSYLVLFLFIGNLILLNAL